MRRTTPSKDSSSAFRSARSSCAKPVGLAENASPRGAPSVRDGDRERWAVAGDRAVAGLLEARPELPLAGGAGLERARRGRGRLEGGEAASRGALLDDVLEAGRG